MVRQKTRRPPTRAAPSNTTTNTTDLHRNMENNIDMHLDPTHSTIPNTGLNNEDAKTSKHENKNDMDTDADDDGAAPLFFTDVVGSHLRSELVSTPSALTSSIMDLDDDPESNAQYPRLNPDGSLFQEEPDFDEDFIPSDADEGVAAFSAVTPLLPGAGEVMVALGTKRPAEVLDDHDVPTTAVIHVTKRQRIDAGVDGEGSGSGAGGGGGGADGLPGRLSTKLWTQILTYLPPQTLGLVLQINMGLYNLLANDESIWRRTRKIHCAEMPKPVFGLSERAMWELWMGKICMGCGVNGDEEVEGTKVYWGFRRRLCEDCFRAESCEEGEALQRYKVSGRDVMTQLLSALPYATVDSSGEYVSAATFTSTSPPMTLKKIYLTADVEDVHTRYEEAVQMSAAEEWLKGLESEGVSQRMDAERMERWVVKLGGVVPKKATAPSLGSNAITNGQTLILSRAQLPPPPVQPNIMPRTQAEAQAIIEQRQLDIESRCLLLNPPLRSVVLAHIPSYHASLKIAQPLTDASWSLLLPKLLSQRSQAEATILQDFESQRLTEDRKLLDAQEKEVWIQRERAWEESQKSVREKLAKIADEVIDAWEGLVTVDTASKFAASVLIDCRKRWYTLPPPESDTRLVLENMKILFDSKIKPLTDPIKKDLFLCRGCGDINSTKLYGFEGVIQHYAAKHTTTLSQGSVVVHWRAEWPEVPPFHEDAVKVLKERRMMAEMSYGRPQHQPQPNGYGRGGRPSSVTGVTPSTYINIGPAPMGYGRAMPMPIPSQQQQQLGFRPPPPMGMGYGRGEDIASQFPLHGQRAPPQQMQMEIHQYSQHQPAGLGYPPPQHPPQQIYPPPHMPSQMPSQQPPYQAYPPPHPQQMPQHPPHQQQMPPNWTDHYARLPLTEQRHPAFAPPIDQRGPTSFAPLPNYPLQPHNYPPQPQPRHPYPVVNEYPQGMGYPPLSLPTSVEAPRAVTPEDIRRKRELDEAERLTTHRTLLSTLTTTALEAYKGLSDIKDLPPSIRVFATIHETVDLLRKKFPEVKVGVQLFHEALREDDRMKSLRAVGKLECKSCPLTSSRQFTLSLLFQHFESIHALRPAVAGEKERKKYNWLMDMIKLPSEEEVRALKERRRFDVGKLRSLVKIYQGVWEKKAVPALSVDVSMNGGIDGDAVAGIKSASKQSLSEADMFLTNLLGPENPPTPAAAPSVATTTTSASTMSAPDTKFKTSEPILVRKDATATESPTRRSAKGPSSVTSPVKEKRPPVSKEYDHYEPSPPAPALFGRYDSYIPSAARPPHHSRAGSEEAYMPLRRPVSPVLVRYERPPYGYERERERERERPPPGWERYYDIPAGGPTGGYQMVPVGREREVMYDAGYVRREGYEREREYYPAPRPYPPAGPPHAQYYDSAPPTFRREPSPPPPGYFRPPLVRGRSRSPPLPQMMRRRNRSPVSRDYYARPPSPPVYYDGERGRGRTRGRGRGKAA